jgi:hypothetical protein
MPDMLAMSSQLGADARQLKDHTTKGHTREGIMGKGKDLRNHFETLFNKRDWEGFSPLFASDAVYATPNFRHDGRGAIRAFCENVAEQPLT